MSTRRRFLSWGIFLICLGSVPIAAQLGWIDASTLGAILRLWPLIIIGIGLSVALRFSPYRVVGSVLSAAVFGLLLGVVFAGGVASPALACTGTEPTEQPITRTGSFAGPAASVNIELTCGELVIARGGGPDWAVAVKTTGNAPVIAASEATLNLHSSVAQGFGPFSSSDERWQVTLPAATSISAEVTLNAASGDLALGNGALDNVSVTYNAADGRLDLRGADGPASLSTTLNASTVRLLLPDEPIQASITLNVSSLTICVPPSAALRIGYSNTLGTNDFASAGLQGSGENWSTPADSSAAVPSSLHISSNLSSISIDRSGDCT